MGDENKLLKLNQSARRTVLKQLGVLGVAGLAGTGTAVAESFSPPSGPDQDPKSIQDSDSYTGPDMRGDGDFIVGLGTNITAQPPRWSNAYKNGGKWNYDFAIHGTTACRFVDENGEAIEGEKNKEMWYQQTNVSAGVDIYSRDQADWVASVPSPSHSQSITSTAA